MAQGHGHEHATTPVWPSAHLHGGSDDPQIGVGEDRCHVDNDGHGDADDRKVDKEGDGRVVLVLPAADACGQGGRQAALARPLAAAATRTQTLIEPPSSLPLVPSF